MICCYVSLFTMRFSIIFTGISLALAEIKNFLQTECMSYVQADFVAEENCKLIYVPTEKILVIWLLISLCPVVYVCPPLPFSLITLYHFHFDHPPSAVVISNPSFVALTLPAGACPLAVQVCRAPQHDHSVHRRGWYPGLRNMLSHLFLFHLPAHCLSWPPICTLLHFPGSTNFFPSK